MRKLAAPVRPCRFFKLLGGSAKALAPEIAASLQKINLTDPLKVHAALSAHGIWITDCARTEIQARPNDFSMTRKAARRATVLAAPRAKLLHFDGEPQFDRETWDLIVRVALEAPPGLTWFEPDWPWNTKSPRVDRRGGGRRLVCLEPSVRSVHGAGARGLSLALGYVRNRLKEQGTPPLQPQTMWADYRRSFQSLMYGLSSGSTGTAEDKGGAFQSLKKAFDVLAKFYKEA
jgi:hypothetical protein